MKVLIIKLTSMGDLMHALPALTEAQQNIKNISFDWVVDKAFSSVPSWHPSVNKIITTDHRTWRKQFFSSESRDALRKVRNEINNTQYDFVIDMQNNLKSAFISFLCKQEITGMDARSSREYPAHWAYSTKVNIEKSLHAVVRQKQILSSCLNYETSTQVNYGISKTNFIKPENELPKKYMVLVQNASWPSKQWSMQNWKGLVRHISNQGINILLPSGNETEILRAKEIASVSEKAEALEIMPLNEVAYVIDNADYCVCSDTGLAHLSAVVGTPSLTLYGPTDTSLIGTIGIDQSHLVGLNGNINSITLDTVIKEIRIATSMKSYEKLT